MELSLNRVSRGESRYFPDFDSVTDRLIRLGPFCFVTAMAAFGVQNVVYARFGVALGPPWTLGYPIGAWATGAVLIASAVCIAARKQALFAADLLAAVLLLHMLYHLPKLVANLHNPNAWTSNCELLAMGGASLVFAGALRLEESDHVSDKVAGLGRFCFAFSLMVFGIQHFMYLHFVAALIPAWLPGHLFWAAFTGTAFIAAGLSIGTRVFMRLGATLLGMMFLVFVLTLHLPRVAAAPRDANEWTSGLVALAMCGGALVMAGKFTGHQSRVSG